MRRLLMIAVGAITAATTLSAVGLAAASASPAVSGTEHIQFMSTSATSTRSSLIAYGVFTAHGVDVHGARVDTIKFANGSFQVTHSPGKGPQTFNPRTCLFVVSKHGTYTIAHGTGAYRGISGSGKYQLNIDGIGAKSGGKCTQRKPPVAFQQVIKASGPLSQP